MRADVYLTVNGHTSSRQQAKRLIEEGNVMVDGKTVRKASEEIPDGSHTVELRNSLAYVGRGGLKLEAALNAFSLDVENKVALDIGASTGGFTDCLLQRGAAKVYAVDSGAGQLAASLREDHRVVSMENCNARYLTADALGDAVDLVVMDVGALTGGFTDCLLRRGAQKVYSIDVGYGQLAWSLRQDPRVKCMERTNIRYVTPDMLEETPSLAVIDVYFI